MCTVTFVPQPNGYVLTSNRDEKNVRPTIFPKEYLVKGKTLYFPKDEVAGGTWIATDGNNKTACLLNGAFENHKKQPNYRKSRGLVLLESFIFKNFQIFVEEVILEEIEPFTLLLLEVEPTLKFLELRWDGKEKHVKQIDTTSPQIWSSSTLYSQEIRTKREGWFKTLIQKNNNLTPEILMQFHTSNNNDEIANAIVMQRANGLQTVSVSQIISAKNQQKFTYFDLIANQKHCLTLETK